ncbi:MAG: cytochrome ubiquinol oxidase subunit I [Candidatus Saccharimonadales bacterium]
METAARLLIGDSLGFHLLFVMIGVGLPFVIVLFEAIALRRQDKYLLEQVKRWSIAAVIFAITGVMSGTLIAVQFSLVWPHFMAFASQVVGPAFMFEGYFFLIEAVFLALYTATWHKIRGWKHWMLGVGVLVGALGSAVVITLVNAWMNNPVGFEMYNGVIENVSISTALFTYAGLVTVLHSVLSYITVVSYGLMAVYGVASRRPTISMSRRKSLRSITLGLAILGVGAMITTMVFGHATAQRLYKDSPLKLAAYELQINTESEAPLRLGGYYDETTNEVRDAIVLPGLLSFLSDNRTDTVVTGLSQTPLQLWPPLVVHTLFDIKIVLAVISLLIPVSYVISSRRMSSERLNAASRTSSIILTLAAIATFVVVELGWIMAELARQPYAIKGYLLTSEAVTRDHSVFEIGIVFPIIFTILLVMTCYAVIVTQRRIGGGKKGYE